MVKEIGGKIMIEKIINFILSLFGIKNNSDEIIEKTNIPRRKINRIITRLKEKELIVREGSNKDGYWKILKQ